MNQTATKRPAITLPGRLELEYMLSQRYLMSQLQWYLVSLLGSREDRRQDGRSGLEAFLQMSAPEILDEQKLRRRLRLLATELTDQKLRELSALLGTPVRAPSPGMIDAWIESQVIAIYASVQKWLATAAKKISESASREATIGELVLSISAASKELSQSAEARASFRLLQLNSQIIEEVARGAGSSHYRWVTENDSRVRENHQPLHEKIFAWASPPTGGGTRPGDVGHPGSGYGCRCIAEPIPFPRTRLQAAPAAP